MLTMSVQMFAVVWATVLVWMAVSTYRAARAHHQKSLVKAEPKPLTGQALYNLEHDAVDWTGVPIKHTEEERCSTCNPELPQVVVLPKEATLYEVPTPAYRKGGADLTVGISPQGLVGLIDDPQARAKEADRYYAQVEEAKKKEEALYRQVEAKRASAWDSGPMMLKHFAQDPSALATMTIEEYTALRPTLFSPSEIRVLEWVETKDDPKPLAHHQWPRRYPDDYDAAEIWSMEH